MSTKMPASGVYLQLDDVRRMATPRSADAELERLKAEAAAEGRRQGYEDGKERGYRKGFKDGFENGKQQALEEGAAQTELALAALAVELTQTKAFIEAAIQQYLHDSEERITDLCMNALRDLLEHEIATNREATLHIVRRALAEVTQANNLILKVGIADMPKLMEHREALMAHFASLQDIDLILEPSIQGGCIVETSGGIVDARTELWLDEVELEVRKSA